MKPSPDTSTAGRNEGPDGARETLLAFFAAWQNPVGGAIDQVVAYLDSDFSGLGTGSDDVYASPVDVREVFQREMNSTLEPGEIEITFLRVNPLREDLVLIDGQIHSEVEVDGYRHVVNPRFTVLLDRQTGAWTIRYFHFSLPDSSQTPGDTLVDALRAQTSQLEREVAQRTAELHRSLADLQATQAQLVQQEKMASLGQLTAGIAHEIKNPLNFINNFAEINENLAEELLEAITSGGPTEDLLDDLKQNASIIKLHGKRADGIVHAMMQHASGGNGERISTNVNQLVSEHIDLIYHGKQAQVPDFKVEIERDLGKNVGKIEIVPQEIGRVLLNLLGNAFDAVGEQVRTEKHGDPGDDPTVDVGSLRGVAEAHYGKDSATVRVTTRRIEDHIEIRVADNGPGVPAEIKERIFEPFFTTKPTGSGTGLGLSLSYDIITHGYGGTLTLESQEGEGATFIVRLPLIQTVVGSRV